MFLTKQQLTELTGYKRPSFMIEKLKEYGLRFFIAKDGYPRVLEAELNPRQTGKKTLPDFEALNDG